MQLAHSITRVDVSTSRLFTSLTPIHATLYYRSMHNTQPAHNYSSLLIYKKMIWLKYRVQKSKNILKEAIPHPLLLGTGLCLTLLLSFSTTHLLL